MSDACQPIFRYGGATVEARACPHRRRCWRSRPAPVRAVIVTHLVIGVPEFVMKVFWPSITHSCVASSSVARVRVAPRVRARLGLGEPERAEHLARDHRHEVLLLLRLGAGVEERRRAEAHARFERDRHRRVDARELLDREAVREVVGAAAAVLLRGTAGRTGRACPSSSTVSTGNTWSRSHASACGAISACRELAHDACGTAPARA